MNPIDRSSGEPAHWRRLVALSGARASQATCAAGGGGIELMIKLCRDGYARVECLRQSTCRCADGDSEAGADVLLIPGATPHESLVSVLRRTARVLRDGGVVAVKLDRIDDDCAVQAALAGLGLETTSTVFDLSHEVLVSHTVRRAQVATATAAPALAMAA